MLICVSRTAVLTMRSTETRFKRPVIIFIYMVICWMVNALNAYLDQDQLYQLRYVKWYTNIKEKFKYQMAWMWTKGGLPRRMEKSLPPTSWLCGLWRQGSIWISQPIPHHSSHPPNPLLCLWQDNRASPTTIYLPLCQRKRWRLGLVLCEYVSSDLLLNHLTHMPL